jgi:hypothetical protein
MQSAVIENARLIETPYGRYLLGTCVTHPAVGERGIYVGGPLRTSTVQRVSPQKRVVTTRNTRYRVKSWAVEV